MVLYVGEYEPALHHSHTAPPDPDEKLPAEQVKHVVALDADEYDPAPHHTHDAAPAPDE